MFNITLPDEYGNITIVLRPIPLISISQTPIRNKKGLLGSYYDITLTGTILADYSTPYYRIDGNSGGVNHALPTKLDANYLSTTSTVNREKLDVDHAMASIIFKQNILRELFSIDGCKYELLPASVVTNVNIYDLSEEPILIFYPTLQSISFEEGTYVNISRYTVTLRAEVLLDQGNKVISDGLINHSLVSSKEGINDISRISDRQDINSIIQSQGGFIEDYSESWALELDEAQGITNTSQDSEEYTHTPETGILSSRGYRLTRNITVTGRTIYETENKVYPAWQQAKGYIEKTILADKDNNTANNSTGYEQYIESTYGSLIGSGLINLGKDIFGGYNHARTFSIDETAGSVTLTDTWFLCSGTAYENYNMSLNGSNDTPTQKISINGTIKGLTSASSSSTYYGGNDSTSNNMSYRNALNKWHEISNIGQYGPNCYLFKRAQSVSHLPLNHIPLSVALGTNEFTGEITYTIDYDSRPSNLITGTLSESINCSDTYPGDVFAVIPVIGRATGPIIQYIGGRTEYQRSLSIDLTFSQYYDSGSQGSFQDRLRRFGILSKPSLNEPYRSQINSVVSAYSPANEYGIRKYFLSAPQETWDAKSGKYTLNLTWTYELGQ